MSLSTMNVQYEDETVFAKITVRKASVREGLLRSKLADEGLRFPDIDPLIHAARWLQYPAVRAGTVSGKIAIWDQEPDPESATGYKSVDKKNTKPEKLVEAKNIDFDTWLYELPEALLIDWLEAVFTVNPHWVLAEIGGDEAKKG